MWTAFFGKGKKDEKTNWRLVENILMQPLCQTFIDKQNSGHLDKRRCNYNGLYI